MAYQPYEWNTGDPITQEKMRRIENGIADAHSLADLAQSTADYAKTTADANTQSIETISDQSATALREARDAKNATEAGQKAWTQVAGAITIDPTTGEVIKNLATRLNEISEDANTKIEAVSSIANSASDRITLLNTEITAARSGQSNLKAKIDSMDTEISLAQGAVTSIQDDYDAAKGNFGSLTLRLGAIDGNPATMPAAAYDALVAAGGRLGTIENELSNARGQNADLDARLDAIESTTGSLGTDTVKYTDVKNNLTSTDTNKPLSAAMGKELKDTIGGSYSPLNTVAAGISSAADTAETNAKNYADSLVGTGIDSTHTVASKISALESADTDLDSRLDALEAARPSTTDDQTGEVTYGTLDDRFDAVEDAAAQLRTDVNAIAGELAMMDNESIVTTNSRVDTLENDLRTMAAELDMLDGTAIVDTNTRVDGIVTNVTAIQGELNDARIQIGTDDESGDPIMSTLDQRLDRMDTVTNNIINAIDQVADDSDPEHPIPAGLTQRLTAAEGDIDNLENAISHTKDPLDANDKGGLEQRMDAVENVAGNAATSSALNNLADRVTTLENQPKSATVVMDSVTYDSITGEPSNINNPSTDVDYLLKKEDKYYYWKYIKTSSNPDTYAWALISGGGGSGTGNSSGVVLTEQEYNDVELVKEENTDYFVQKTDGYHHYRWIPTEIEGVLEQIEIGDWASINKDKIKRYNIYKTSEGTGADEKVYLNLYQYDYDAESTAIDTENLDNYFARVELPKGGTGTSSTTVNQLIRLGNQTIETIVGSTVKLRVFFSSYDGPQKNDGDYVLKAGSTTIETGKIYSCDDKDEVVSGWKANTAGYQEFDVTGYCKAGSTNFTLTVTVNETSLGKNWTVDMKDLRIESDAPDTLLIPSDESYVFPYTPFGALEKYLHVVIDGDTTHETTVRLVSSTSGRPNNVTITPEMITATGNAIHGAHTIKLYLTATIGGIQQTTDSINREYIWYDATDTETPVIIASPYNGQTLAINQYSTITIPYQVYKKDATSIDVYYYLDEELEPFDHVELEETNVGTLAYLASTTGSHTLTIKVDDQSVVVNLTVTAIEGVDISPITGAVIDFDPTSLTNSSINRLPSWTAGGTTYSLTASNNFNWSDDVNGGGYKQDEDGRCFVIKAGSYVDLNYKMFENNVFDTGAEIKVIFKTKAVRNADAVWFSNTGSYNDKTVGIQLGAHVGWLKTDKAVDTDQENIASQYASWVSSNTYNVDDLVVYDEIIYKCIKAVADDPETADVNETTVNPKDASDNWLAMGKIDTEVLSTNSYLYLPYSEKDKIELDININKYTQGATNNFIMSYEDGVPSKAYAYTYGLSGDGLIHNNGIRIGSADCDVYIYHLRIYNKALTTAQILQNFIADGSDIDAKISRYNRNCIYWDSTQDDGQGRYFTSPSGTAVLDPIKLAEKIPNVKILMLDTPTFTVGKKNFIPNSTLRCIHARGGDLYPSRGDADNWFFEKGLHAGQGTTSDNYGQSSRNIDFLFICDKVHWPTKEKNVKKTFDITKPENKDYQSSVIIGENATKWDEGTETWVPTTIWDDTNEEWVANTDILSAAELQAWTASPPDYCLDWKGDNCKVALTSTSIPNNYFNLKVNVASSENVNNALFQERYNEFLSSVYQSPAYKRDHKIKNDMEFVPAILFVRENDPTKDAKGNYSKHNEFNDTKWHFYALGNIGDSKKTDYTRAYNPKDMNEFTVENSDNNTNNGQFQSGVFESNNVRYLETDFATWSDTVAYKQNDIVIVNNKIYKRSAADMAALGENETATWVAADWTDVTPVTTETINYAPRTNPNPMDYIFPISSEEWNVQLDGEYLNRKHATLVNEEFDGDHSFEFRYACMGDYRDGDLINDTTGLAKAQFNTNHQLVLDFYEWLVTAPEETFETEAAHWIIPEAMEFFYAYTHYYTMMDNRAKNTFWHWGKNYITSNDANGANYNTARLAAEAAQTAYDEAADDAEAAETEQRPIITQAEADIAAANETLQEDPTDAEALAAKAQAEQDKADAEAIIAAAETAKKNAKSQLNARIIKRDELKFLYDHADCFVIDNAEAAINEGRRFDLWAYDMDKCLSM